jgi:all-trans-8'-apo-beta-carotenal 15,15'-oxygenase
MMSTARALSEPLSPVPAPSWQRAFRDFTQEHGFQPLHVEGRLPKDLRGTLVRVGPIAFGVGGQHYGHWFDGDGGALAVRFEGGRALGAARAIDTPTIRAEREAGKPLSINYGTMPSSLLGRLRAKVKNTANTSAMAWNGRLFALVEATKPTELSLKDLRTLGETDLGGAVTHAFSAHPRHVASRRTTYNFGMRYGRVPMLDLYALPDAGPIRALGTVPLPGLGMLHDFVATERHLVFFFAPLRLKFLQVMLRGVSLSRSAVWQPELGLEILVVPIDAPSRVVRVQTDAFYTWHFANAWEDGERLVVDHVRYPDFGTNQWLTELPFGPASTDAQGQLYRTTVDLKAKTARHERLSDRRCEFPLTTPLLAGVRHRYLYRAGYSGPEAWRGPQDVLLKLDMETGVETVVSLGNAQYPSEALFVPRAGSTAEDDGWLLTLVYDAPSDTSHVAVLDARAPGAGPVARAWFDHFFPFTFHGTWVPAG